MTFFSKLYAYKQSPVRSSLEDFLTELLARCEWLMKLATPGGPCLFYSSSLIQSIQPDRSDG